MKKYRFFISFVFTIFLYTSLGFLFFFFQQHFIKIAPLPNKEKRISFALSSFELPPLLPLPIIENKPLEEHKEVVEKMIPKPLIKKEILLVSPIIKKKKVIQKKIKKRHIKKKKIRKYVKKRKIQKSRKKRNTVKQKKGIYHKINNNLRFSHREKNRFLSNLRKKINDNKSYPRLARRRGIQGTIKVSFKLLNRRQISHLKIVGKSLFKRSVKEAILKAFPLKIKKIPLKLPQTIHLTLHFQLK